MINKIRLVDFQDTVKCNSILYQSKESFLKINYEFKKGKLYGLVSDFGCGSWGLSSCIGGRCSSDYSGKVLLNDYEINGNDLVSHSCFISENIISGINSKEELLTPKKCIEKALSISLQPYTVDEIKKLFYLSEGRFDRSLNMSSGEIWNISIAINFSMGKEIFCFPWLNILDINRFTTMIELGIIDLLKRTGKIIIVPSSQEKILKKYCDHTITFKKERIVYK